MAGLTQRQIEILNVARASGRVMVEDLARRFEVSAQTIRKDLNNLCEQRSLRSHPRRGHHCLGVENLADEARGLPFPLVCFLIACFRFVVI